MTAVLHTHNRRLDYHPHIHVVVPGGSVDKAKKQWKKKKSKYLFNEFALAKVFRARFVEALISAGLVPRKWVVNCIHAGKGLSALKYLSRYLKKLIQRANLKVPFNVTCHSLRHSMASHLNDKGTDIFNFATMVIEHISFFTIFINTFDTMETIKRPILLVFISKS
jgi:site-specific recombinase XerD